jgi:hypothetical protein
MAKQSKAAAIKEQESRQERRIIKAWNAVIDADGEVHGSDNIREEVQANLYFNPVFNCWLSRNIRGGPVVRSSFG